MYFIFFLSSNALNQHLKLRKHMFVHTGEQPYACAAEGCSASFVSQSKLDLHAQRHSGVPRYACGVPECGGKFATWTQLQEHNRAAHRGVEFRCETCHKHFASQRLLNAHLITHDPNRTRIACAEPGCAETFTTVTQQKCLRNND